MVAFEMVFKEAKVKSSLTLFRHFYDRKITVDFTMFAGGP